eukprot:3533173-Prymnesium_polylepis.3
MTKRSGRAEKSPLRNATNLPRARSGLIRSCMSSLQMNNAPATRTRSNGQHEPIKRRLRNARREK